MDNVSHRPRLDQLQRAHGGLASEPLAVRHRVDATGCGLNIPDCLPLGQGGHAGLVALHVLAVLHGGHGDAGPFRGNGCGQDHVDGRVLVDLLRRRGNPGVGVPQCEGFPQLGFHGVDRGHFGSGFHQVGGHAIDVAVVEADRGQSDRGWRSGHGFVPEATCDWFRQGWFRRTACRNTNRGRRPGPVSCRRPRCAAASRTRSRGAPRPPAPRRGPKPPVRCGTPLCRGFRFPGP